MSGINHRVNFANPAKRASSIEELLHRIHKAQELIIESKNNEFIHDAAANFFMNTCFIDVACLAEWTATNGELPVVNTSIIRFVREGESVKGVVSEVAIPEWATELVVPVRMCVETFREYQTVCPQPIPIVG
jgi:hypothetical protein